MDVLALNEELHGIDIALLDQVLKGRFRPGTRLLDVGYGSGRNSFWFINNGFDVFGIDQNPNARNAIHEKLAEIGKDACNFITGQLEKLPYEENSFDVVICSAVLHFANNPEHFHDMFAQLVRVLKPPGVLFIRIASDIGLEKQLEEGDNGVFLIPDGSHRFLLTRDMLVKLVQTHNLNFLEPLKTVNVNDMRCMSTLVLSKQHDLEY